MPNLRCCPKIIFWETQESHKKPHNSWCSSHNLNQVPLNTSQLHYYLTHLIKFINIIPAVTSFILRVKLKKEIHPEVQVL
jgi:hypothetical protein